MHEEQLQAVVDEALGCDRPYRAIWEILSRRLGERASKIPELQYECDIILSRMHRAGRLDPDQHRRVSAELLELDVVAAEELVARDLSVELTDAPGERAPQKAGAAA